MTLYFSSSLKVDVKGQNSRLYKECCLREGCQVHSIVDLPGKRRGTAIERMHEKSIGAVYNKAFKSCFSKRLRYKDVQMQEFIL